MGRPPLGPDKRSRTIGVHVTQAQYELIAQLGRPSVWARKVVLDALVDQTTGRKPRTKPKPTPQPAPPPTDTPTHRHRRVRVGEKWVGGVDVGEWRCGDCDVVLGVFQ